MHGKELARVFPNCLGGERGKEKMSNYHCLYLTTLGVQVDTDVACSLQPVFSPDEDDDMMTGTVVSLSL